MVVSDLILAFLTHCICHCFQRSIFSPIQICFLLDSQNAIPQASRAPLPLLPIIFHPSSIVRWARAWTICRSYMLPTLYLDEPHLQEEMLAPALYYCIVNTK